MQTIRLAGVDWSGLGRGYLFFWFFTGITHLLLLFTGATGFVPFRQGVIFSLLWLIPLLLFPHRTRILSIIIGLTLWIGSLVNLGYFSIYQQEFSQSVLFIIFESNPAEASEYLDQYLAWWMPVFVLAYTALAYWLWRQVRPIGMAIQARLTLAAVILIALLVPPVLKSVNKGGNVGKVAEAIANRMEPALPWQFVIGFARYQDQLVHMQSLLNKNESLPPVANLSDQRAGKPATIVMIIGESTNRQHMGLYGYARKTSPELESIRDKLTVFNEVYAARPYTIEALQQVLTFADQENPDIYLTKPSLMNIMKQAGYKTYWITNQQTLTKRNTMLTTFSEQMDEQVYLNHQRSQNSYSFDGNVIEPFERFLGDGAERKFIVVHLLGTHMRYKYRFPDSYDKFKDKSGLPGWAGDNQATMINEYDNAILYNDYVVSSLIRKLDATGQNSMLLYFSDHGEDVYDWPPHEFIGRNEAKPTPPMYAIPFLLWTSDAWKKSDPRNFDAYRNRVYQTSHLIHSWADLTGLRFEGFDATKSIFHPDFKERPILVGNPERAQSLIDLRSLLGKQGQK